MTALNELNLTEYPIPVTAFHLSLHAGEIEKVVRSNTADPVFLRAVFVVAIGAGVAMSYLMALAISSNTFLPLLIGLIPPLAAVVWAVKPLKHYLLVQLPQARIKRLAAALQPHFDSTEGF